MTIEPFAPRYHQIEVTSLHRPNVDWGFVDAQGHTHQWWTKGVIATSYNPENRHELPTLRYVEDETRYYEDGEPYVVGHYECAICGEHITPGYKPDDTPQFIRGLAYWPDYTFTVTTADEYEQWKGHLFSGDQTTVETPAGRLRCFVLSVEMDRTVGGPPATVRVRPTGAPL